MIPALVLAGFLMVKAPMLLAKVLSGATMGAAKTAAESYKLSNVITNDTGETSDLFPIAQPEMPKTNSPPHAFTLHPPTLGPDSERKTDGVYLTGISSMNGKFIVFLSNGETFTSDDRELKFASKRVAVIGGKRYVFAPPPSAGKDGVNQSRNPFQ